MPPKMMSASARVVLAGAHGGFHDELTTTMAEARHCATDYPADFATGSARVVLAGAHGGFHNELTTTMAEARYGGGRGARDRNHMFLG
jgi:hypothetical protein